jgi:hypothetical protein
VHVESCGVSLAVAEKSDFERTNHFDEAIMHDDIMMERRRFSLPKWVRAG